jgi:hypothetical protein
MIPHPLAHLIPVSNQFSVPTLRSNAMALTNAVEAIYDSGEFQGCFIEDAGGWQARIVRYDNDEFMAETEGPKLFSEIHDSIPANEGDGGHVYSQLAFDAWQRDGKGSEQPYSIFQDSGICVDSSNVEMKWGLIGYLVAKSGGRFSMPWGPAHYAYAERGSCGQGWTLGACATVNQRVGICPAMLIEVGGNRLDFDGENKHERTVTSTWCRSGIPSWLKSWTVENFSFASDAITMFDGGLDALFKLFQNGGQLHHGSNATSGGSSPDSWKRIGGHAQTTFGGDKSERTVRFFSDLGYRLKDSRDFWVPTHQTWGSWSGQTAAKFWPPWWGPQPQGAWVSRASSLLSNVRGMYAYLPRFKWFSGSGPVVPPPFPTGGITLDGTLRADNGSPIRGTLTATCKDGQNQFIIVPDGSGGYKPVLKGM